MRRRLKMINGTRANRGYYYYPSNGKYGGIITVCLEVRGMQWEHISSGGPPLSPINIATTKDGQIKKAVLAISEIHQAIRELACD